MDYGRYIADWNRLDAVLGTVAGEEANSRGVWYWIGSQRRFTAEMGKRKASNVWMFCQKNADCATQDHSRSTGSQPRHSELEREKGGELSLGGSLCDDSEEMPIAPACHCVPADLVLVSAAHGGSIRPKWALACLGSPPESIPAMRNLPSAKVSGSAGWSWSRGRIIVTAASYYSVLKTGLCLEMSHPSFESCCPTFPTLTYKLAAFICCLDQA
ncbi:predicted protein [Histoplasma capsulatum G186AR]|uniref:Uncharacterized protein n=1 Tax=Ajellomyces capsulatus (strain G186AR / H82 / ATCC MYA-2454 / RMSCC 2432) TaxID=447093 RepID=C0NI10_AJECG|nr:uncharacterized protein HCBG_02982 [Histoplasma capsulatum G186AR]EEH09445.1 predicted protein [Histoplasma capsulatum G186AR]